MANSVVVLAQAPGKCQLRCILPACTRLCSNPRLQCNSRKCELAQGMASPEDFVRLLAATLDTTPVKARSQYMQEHQHMYASRLEMRVGAVSFTVSKQTVPSCFVIPWKQSLRSLMLSLLCIELSSEHCRPASGCLLSSLCLYHKRHAIPWLHAHRSSGAASASQ